MKPLLLIALLFVSFCSFGQTRTDSSASEQYCLLRVYSYSFSNKVQVSVDYGNKTVRGRNILRNEDGDRMKFNSEADALNFFGNEGWKLVNAFPVVESRDHHTRYVFKRPIPADE
jgi:outer membrane lipoprotein-sorting protein